ncbi:hypothetical protein COCC4DRAFT_138849 [Bipolaris maydis ATCC 48331]|uniref:Uncharacterized protein n=2 Tax=Cochliobolus heterostrophus TaxID=5016 RepID=M2SV65_COCH5|nr:uncharacterized protein COCC4DRAFT_138849 [Bipolaris maydis ATCC 48331]EMD89255.1 hypothetical protein COCHEDRAFT_1107829 [Bipolaris maydis C5]ENI05028.1 hypothetical protein COCC4DRAFT_138849 [Bipolaris maydis ATCC 48331]KAJ6212613.1 hypothetical protein PSV09DRAFT_1107829 [Bipolaris maydis]
MSGMIATFAILISYCGTLISLRIGLKLDAGIERMQTADSKSNALPAACRLHTGRGGTGRVL